jgi:hypothetical protein
MAASPPCRLSYQGFAIAPVRWGGVRRKERTSVSRHEQQTAKRKYGKTETETERGKNIIAAVLSLARVRFSIEGKGRFQNDNKLHLQEMTS